MLAWGGVGKTSHVPVQPIYTISLLVPGGARLRDFTGFREGAPALRPRMSAFHARLAELDPTGAVPPLIVEIHDGVSRKRINAPPPPPPPPGLG
jgi:hypothetical protein